MKQITFELLRHGPPNNQLLSPLTPYLALCEDHPAMTLRLPFEHNQFLHRLRALSYKLDGESRAFQVKDTAQVIGELIGTVPGLVAEMNRDENGENGAGNSAGEGNRLTHLRMVLTASELALLPFELALSPAGFPGAGQPLLLQSQNPICLTREVRRVAERTQQWSKKPKVLFVAAQPGDVGSIPFEAHLNALKELIAPWVDYAATPEEATSKLADHLVVLENASCNSIEEACAEHEFSHIHILAHGIQYEEGYDVRFGLALHNPLNPFGEADRVNGERLASAIRAVKKNGGGRLARPLAVTLASCDSGNQGGIGGLGGSIAFALHQAGVPMVVASQFPMSVAASHIFVRVLYDSFLWGRDTRVALNDLRRRLHVLFPATHDWASISAYVALPEDFENQLFEFEFNQTKRSMESAMRYADRAMDAAGRPELLRDALEKIERGEQRLENLYDRRKDRSAKLAGQLAATKKRSAQIHYEYTQRNQAATPGLGGARDWREVLNLSRRHYWDAFTADRKDAWGAVQYLSLDLVLRNLEEPLKEMVLERIEDYNDTEALWSLAHILSINDARSSDPQIRKWALGNLVELYLLENFQTPAKAGAKGKARVNSNAVQRARELVDAAGPNSFEVYSTRRQMLRYKTWYSKIARLGALMPTVDKVLDVIPDAPPPDQI